VTRHGLFVCLLFTGLAACHRGAQYYVDRGNKLFAQGKFEEAALNYQTGLKQDPRSAELHYRLALADIKLAQNLDAYQELVASVTIAPERDEIRIAQADLALQLYSGDSHKPKALYNQVEHTADALLKKDPNSFDGLRLLGDRLAMDGKFEEAVESFRKGNAVKPLDPSVIDPMVQALFLLKRFEEGEKLALQLIDTRKDAAHMYDVLAQHYLLSGDSAATEKILKQKVTNLPKDSTGRLQLASFYHSQKRDSEMHQTLGGILSDPKAFPQGQILVGDFYGGIGRLDDALQTFRQGLAADPKDENGYKKKMARVFIAQGRRDDAIQQLDQVLKAKPDDSDARLARAILLREANDPNRLDLAVKELTALITTTPNDAIARYNLGMAQLAKNDPKAAQAQFTESARLGRGYIEPRVAMAETAQKTHNYSEVIRWSQEALAIDPDNADAKLLHCAGLIGTKSYQQARGELTTLLKQYPDSVNVNLHMAVLDTAEKKYRESEDRYLKVYKPGQPDVRPLEGLIQLYGQQKQIDKALNLLESALKSSPDSVPVHLLLGSVAAQAGKLELATTQFEWLRQHNPQSSQAYASLGDIYQLKGDVSTALANYRKASELSPNDSKNIAMVAYLESLSGQNQDAIVNLRKQLAADPENAIAQNNLAMALADTGTDLDQALALADKAQRKMPQNPGVADTLGWVYTKKGLNDSAIQTFRGLVKKYPDEPVYRYHLAVALLQKGQTADAKAELAIGLSKNPAKDLADKMKEIASKIG
jgi:tetratricopeptide (TPR) repeat protein